MRFFFYGTLIAGSGNPIATWVHRKLEKLGPATVSGRLFAIPDPLGWYPALVTGAGMVSGVVYQALPDFTPRDLARMDSYEDYDPAAVRRSLYRRILVPVHCEAGARRRALAYVFNRALPAGSRRIAHGDFPAWLARTGNRAFGG